jgi:uncharacterized damage-inducible protein DinB
MRVHALVLALSLSAAPVGAQGLMADFHTDVNDVQEKVLALANAIPETAYDWRPAAGVRSVGEVFIHIAADNYLIPVAMGKPAPAETGIDAANYNTVLAYEARKMTKAQVIATLQASFAHLHSAMNLTTEANLSEQITFFGRPWSRQRAMILTVTHLHEHLGQMIAYARSNNVKPPWSN